jgi:hypothetical protein
MTNDAEWVEDVRRWVASASAAPSSDAVENTDLMALGYEAAHPALQARHWPEALATGFGEPR